MRVVPPLDAAKVRDELKGFCKSTGLSVADISERSNVEYQRTWRFMHGGNVREEELNRLRAVLDGTGEGEHSTPAHVEAKAS